MLILSREDVARLMAPADYVDITARAFADLANGRVVSPMPMHVAADGGGFHAKAALSQGEPPVFALKLNGNFPDNPSRGLPTIQGFIVLCRADDGQVLAVMDSVEVTLRRTAAASAVAARHLARPDSATLTVCGCGEQGEAQVRALAAVLPIRRVFACDIDPKRAASMAGRCAGLGLQIEVGDAATCGPLSDVIVTCTTSRSAWLERAHVAPGAFVAAVGADSFEKSEIAPDLLASARLVTDVSAECAVMGDLHWAIAAGLMTTDDVHAELGEVMLGRRPGRRRAEEVTIFDSTGVAVQDLASAIEIHRRASA